MNLIDQIHGRVYYPDYVFEIINTHEFQRLRNVKQMGVASYVFPGATNTRFEHCLGVCHLVNQLLDTLEKNSKIIVPPFHRKCVAIAGLLHDIGHGPFSHMWEQFVHEGRYSNWNHEDTSCDVTRSLFEKNNIRLSTDHQEHLNGIEMIVAYIRGDLNKLQQYLSKDEMYLTEIVNNKFCFVDVDKWDYLLRDSYNLNHAISIKKTFDQCFQGVRITPDENGITHISYNIRDYYNIYDLFDNRSNLHLFCYQHPDILGIEKLLLNVFRLAEQDGFLFKGVKLSEAHANLDVFKYLDDSILRYIEISDDPRLSEAKEQLNRIKLRKVYSVIGLSPQKLDLNGDDQFLQIERHIKKASETMPSNIIFHNDQGQIETNPENKNNVTYILYRTDPMGRSLDLSQVTKNLTNYYGP